MIYKKKRILITVKAYPTPSRKYSETVCCAGVDLDSSQFIRLFPIPFRDLDYDKRFKKYSIIEVDCSQSRDDKRPESFRIKIDTIKVLDWLDTSNKWEKRKSLVLKLPVKSMCQVIRDSEERDLSLGLIKPCNISFKVSKRRLSNQKEREAYYAQLNLFKKKKEVIEEIPFDFHYVFLCEGDDDCPGHRLSIIDWEIRQAYRDWRSKYTDEKIILGKIQQKWLDIANTNKKDVYFYVGNMIRLRGIFIVLGVFYPPKS